MSDLKLLILTERLISSASPVINKIPRSQRYRYGARIEDALYALPKLIISAAAAKTKSKVYALCEQVDVIHSLLRIGSDLGFLSSKWVASVMRSPSALDPGGLLRQIAAMSGSWRASIK